jgi:hypothetical protein
LRERITNIVRSSQVHELDDIRGKKSNLKLSVRLNLGEETAEDPQKTKSFGATEGGLLWEKPEEFEFDCFNPESLISEDDLVLVVEVAEKVGSVFSTKEVVAEKSISVKKCLENPGTILEGDDGTSGGWFGLNMAGDDDDNGRIRLDIWFEEARTGLLVMNLQRCIDLKGPGFAIFDKKIDPYVRIKVGKTKVRGKTYKDMDQTFEFKESDHKKKLVCWCNPSNYFDDIVLQVFDENIGTDGLLGEKTVNLMQIMAQGVAHDKKTYHLSTGKKGKEVFKGHIEVIPSFYAAGTLVVNVVCGKDLRSTELVGKNDPYVVVEMKGCQGGKEGDDKQETQVREGVIREERSKQ